MRATLFSKDEFLVVSSGQVRFRTKPGLGTRKELTFWYEPEEGNLAFLGALRGTSRFVIKAGGEKYKVDFLSGEAAMDKPLKFKLT